MIIQCDQCDTKYRLDESLLGKEGSPVRCSKCQYIFTAYPPQSEGAMEQTDWPVDSPSSSSLSSSLSGEDSGKTPPPPLEETTADFPEDFPEDELLDIDDNAWETSDESAMDMPEAPSPDDSHIPTHDPNSDPDMDPNSSFNEPEAPENIDEADIDEADIDEPDIDEPNFDEPYIDEPYIQQPNLNDPNLDQAAHSSPDFGDPYFNETNPTAPNSNAPGFNRLNLDEPSFDEPNFDEPDFDEIDPFIAEDKRSSGLRLFFLMLLMLGIFIGALSGGFFMLNRMGVNIPYVGEFLKTVESSPSIQKIEAFDLVSRTLHIAGGGNRLVISGQVKKNPAAPHQFIEATARLYTGKKELLKTKKVICGNVLSDLELQTLDMSVIDDTLRRFPETAEWAEGDMPQEMLPFMAVFDDFTDQVEMFVVDAAIFVQPPESAEPAR